MPCWLALAGIAYQLWQAEGRPTWQQSLVSGSCFVVIAYLFVRSNLTHEDKAFYLKSRAPVSAACLRHYRTAPPEAEDYVFLWGPHAHSCLHELGNILERRRLSVFGRHQHWTLQGEFCLHTIRRHEADHGPVIAWWHGIKERRQGFDSFNHLNLFLPTSNEIHWTLTLPPRLERSDFTTGVCLSPSTPAEHADDGAVCQVYVEQAGQPRRLIWSSLLDPRQHSWLPCSIALDKFAGQTITLHICSQPRAEADQAWVVWRHPCVDLVLGD
jgi:hypothetical protein